MKWLSPETAIGSIFVAAFGWALMMIVGMKSDVRALQVGEREDKRVNEIVYKMEKTLVRL